MGCIVDNLCCCFVSVCVCLPKSEAWICCVYMNVCNCCYCRSGENLCVNIPVFLDVHACCT